MTGGMIQPANHWSFHLANAFLAVSYVIPSLLLLRACLAAASLCFCLWGFLVLDISVDTGVYNAVFFVINSLQTFRLLYQMRPIKFGKPELELVYDKMFGPGQYGLSRFLFQKLTKHIAFIRTLQKGGNYCDIGAYSHNLSILISGKLQVTARDDKGNPVECNSINAWEFMDSPEYIVRKPGALTKFAVRIQASEDCTYITWPLENLDEAFGEAPELRTCIDALVGKDTAKKLFNLNDVVKETNNKLVPFTESNLAERLTSIELKTRSSIEVEVRVLHFAIRKVDNGMIQVQDEKHLQHYLHQAANVRNAVQNEESKAVVPNPSQSINTLLLRGPTTQTASIEEISSPSNLTSHRLLRATPLGFVVTSQVATFADVRKYILEELDHVPDNFSFVAFRPRSVSAAFTPASMDGQDGGSGRHSPADAMASPRYTFRDSVSQNDIQSVFPIGSRQEAHLTLLEYDDRSHRNDPHHRTVFIVSGAEQNEVLQSFEDQQQGIEVQVQV